MIDAAVRERLISEDPRSAELLKPFLEGRDLKRWHAEPRDLWLIYIPKNRIDIADYPAIEAWLRPFRERLERRATKQAWYELQQAQAAYLRDFESAKIFYPEFSVQPLFHLDTRGFFSNNKCFFIPTDDRYLLGLLNSQAMWFVLTGLCTFVRGGYFEVRANKVELLPIPQPDADTRRRIAGLADACQRLAAERYAVQAGLRRRIPDLCPAGDPCRLTGRLQAWWTLDFKGFQTEVRKAFKRPIPVAERNDWEGYFIAEQAKVRRLSHRLAETEQALDRAVYDLFGLTEAEIALVEASLGPARS